MSSSIPRAAIGASFLMLALLGACGRESDRSDEGAATFETAQVRSARIVLPPPGVPMAAGYFELHNPGKSTLVLESLESSAFESVEMHETVEEDGMARMRPLANATVAAGETLRFEPGGMHLMLTGSKLASDVASPTSITVTLRLRAAAGGEVSHIDAPFAIEQRGATAVADDPHAHHHH
ncbi:MAG: Copper(I)-binding protein [Panacagrimonas sp.]|jgi:copper(I)-binding protein|nr:copper chaperone PCu(A)C [Panacagrimonas sp.]MCC2656871.1 Copper(I)-binding protein [Panacagrimonas sp.]